MNTSAALNGEELTGFDFDEGGRTYSCSIGALGGERAEAWWWFRVSTSRRQTPSWSSLSARERAWLPDVPANRPTEERVAEDPHRYAPFRAAASDTRGSVQARVVAYYDDLVARRDLPTNHSWRRGAR